MPATVVDTVDVVESATEIIFWWCVNKSTQSYRAGRAVQKRGGDERRAIGEAEVGGFPTSASYRRKQQVQSPKAGLRVGRGGPKAGGEAAGCECWDHHQDQGREEGWARTENWQGLATLGGAGLRFPSSAEGRHRYAVIVLY